MKFMLLLSYVSSTSYRIYKLKLLHKLTTNSFTQQSKTFYNSKSELLTSLSRINGLYVSEFYLSIANTG